MHSVLERVEGVAQHGEHLSQHAEAAALAKHAQRDMAREQRGVAARELERTCRGGGGSRRGCSVRRGRCPCNVQLRETQLEEPDCERGRARVAAVRLPDATQAGGYEGRKRVDCLRARRSVLAKNRRVAQTSEGRHV
jgi:hypothetical protein